MSLPAYDLVAGLIRYLAQHRDSQPSLAEIAAQAGLSESHVQRVFAEWAGVSPKQYLQFLGKEDARRRLRERPVAGAAFDAGLSGGGRLHDLMLRWEGVTPGEYRQHGEGVVIRYGLHESPFGHCLLAMTARGICKLAFFDTAEDREALCRELHDDWHAAEILRDDVTTASTLPAIFPPRASPRLPLRLWLRGSAFQIKVWEALLDIPHGEVRSYQQVADAVGRPAAVRAVATAIARNDIGYLIPCHRVIRATGDPGHYRWGDVRKQAMIAREACDAAKRRKQRNRAPVAPVPS